MNNKLQKMPNELKQAIINFYLTPHSLHDCVKQFNLKSRYIVQQVLKESNIPEHSFEIYDSIRKTNLKINNNLKYGVDHVSQLATVQEKRKQTCIEKYGVECTLQNIDIKNKAKQTCLKKYGVDNPSKADCIKNKIKQTCLDKYGVEYISQDENWQMAVKNTIATKTDDEKAKSLDKFKTTMLDRYGVEAFPQSNLYAKKAHRKYYYDDQYFDSSWELALYIYAKDHNEEIWHEPVRLEYIANNKKHYYFPDFKYKGQLIEIKGSQFLTENKKLKCCYTTDNKNKIEAKQKCMDINHIIIWTETDILFATNYIHEHYDKSFLQGFRVKEKSEEETKK